jgi:hypothetical protein
LLHAEQAQEKESGQGGANQGSQRIDRVKETEVGRQALQTQHCQAAHDGQRAADQSRGHNQHEDSHAEA